MKFHPSHLLAVSALPQLVFSAAFTHNRRAAEGMITNIHPSFH
jgi:hypothetical protein